MYSVGERSLLGEIVKRLVKCAFFLKLILFTNLYVLFYTTRVVEFASYSDLKNAIEKLSGKEINGRKIKLIEGSKRHR